VKQNFRQIVLVSIFLVFFALWSNRSLAVETPKPETKTEPFWILIVPGHDNDSNNGASFQNIREADLNVKLGKEILKFFNQDTRFKASLARDEKGYDPKLAEYFVSSSSEIVAFREEARKNWRDKITQGTIEAKTIVSHNNAPENDSLKLYGLNKWANEHNIDLILHVHFNDYPGRVYTEVGTYSGFTIFVPERQLPNASTSQEIGQGVFARLKKYFPLSDAPQETAGLVEDQELIAIGSNAALKKSALLVEYGYVYESQFIHSKIQPLIFRELAYQTYHGLKDYLKSKENVFRENLILPYVWSKKLQKGIANDVDVLALQVALIEEKLYPPEGKTFNLCPLTGIFGDCTRNAVLAFQNKYNLLPTGIVDQETINQLNLLYSEEKAKPKEEFSYDWNNDLHAGVKPSDDVRALQNALIIEGVYNGPITGHFRALTKKAVIELQKKINAPATTGYVGEYTRKFLNQLYSR
jgi:peptidoglycan hydrolase-like protein with peptidoglycan-binding domain